MQLLLQLLFLAQLVSLSTSVSAETHTKVQAALNWQLPVNPCSKPKPLVNHQQVVTESGTYFQAPLSSTSRSATKVAISDIDHYQLDRYKRKNKRWENCVKTYKSELLEEFAILMDSARYGMTKQQAEAILSKLANIQAVIVSPEGKSTVAENPTIMAQSDATP